MEELGGTINFHGSTIRTYFDAPAPFLHPSIVKPEKEQEEGLTSAGKDSPV